MSNSFYNEQELNELGLNSFGENVLISKKASFYAPQKIDLGSNVRIDDFCILSGKIKIGNFIHISAYSALYAGDAGIEMQDFSGLSPRVTLFALTDDFSGEFVIGPMLPDEYRNVFSGKIVLEKYTQIGCGTVVLPDITIKAGTVVGTMSLVKNSLEPWSIYAGIPAKKIKERSKNLLKFSEKI